MKELSNAAVKLISAYRTQTYLRKEAFLIAILVQLQECSAKAKLETIQVVYQKSSYEKKISGLIYVGHFLGKYQHYWRNSQIITSLYRGATLIICTTKFKTYEVALYCGIERRMKQRRRRQLGSKRLYVQSRNREKMGYETLLVNNTWKTFPIFSSLLNRTAIDTWCKTTGGDRLPICAPLLLP